jgi:hypothetical protein
VNWGRFGMLLALALAAIVASQASRADKPTESVHVPGPDGLEGWTLNWPVPDLGYGDERFAFSLSSPATITSFGASQANQSSGNGFSGKGVSKSLIRLGLSTSAKIAY